jgi:type IX secretion system PorP/SprF family membrane protein
MKKLFTIGICCGALIGLRLPTLAQDVHFSQFWETSLLRNPALAGLFEGDYRVQAIYRDQWNNLTNAYRTGSLNLENKISVGSGDDYLTVGLQSFFDRAGTIGWTTTQFLPAINYHKSLSTDKNQYLSLGAMGGWVQRRFDPSKMTTNTTYETGGTGENLVNTSFGYIDGSVGLSYNSQIRDRSSDNFYVGVAYHHFNRPQQSFYFRNANVELNAKWVISAGMRWSVSEQGFITVMADHSRQGRFEQTVAGALYGLRLGIDPENATHAIQAGALLRLNEAFIPVIKIDIGTVSASFSYDITVSTLTPFNQGRGGFEAGLVYRWYKAESTPDARCPRF